MPQITTTGQIGGHPVQTVRLREAGGLDVTLTDYGARITGLWTPDRQGRLADVVLGHDNLADYATDHGYLGATCGRFANRIGGASFPLDCFTVKLTANEGQNQLHGGPSGWDKAVWKIAETSATHVTLTHVSPHGDMGFPGRVEARCTYRIEGLSLSIEMTATTDAPTVVNLAHHSYFNLAGQGLGDILAHRLQITAAKYLPVDAAKIPTGTLQPVAGTPFDFRAARPIGQALPGPEGFDHCFCLDGWSAKEAGGLFPASDLADPASGRRLRLMTDQPGLQLYTGAHFRDTPGKDGAVYGPFAGVALETQGFPDSPNQPRFPSARLDPGQTYRHRMRLDFTPD